jgi:hypothetical protein
MGRKSAQKEQRSSGAPPSAPESEGKRSSALVAGVVVVALAAAGGLAYWRTQDSPSAAPASVAADAGSSPAGAADGKTPDPNEVARNEGAVKALAALGPHKQTTLPPLPFAGYAPPRPPEVVAAAFQFAAEHPEILSYVPCFCGCQHSGHRGNEDCFVRTRDANGDVTVWEDHGLECAVCIDVATRSRQMYSSGASVRDIRAAVEKEFAPNFPSMTPTPKPPSH